ncbi:hypothetical protein H8711_03350 [Clostridiaceae bacterium NSJ-31]|uniref:Alcohol acetyltransferase n=1 Tax=Ligaoa zhengdingensis TaxID=2763658 RepID=A0A926I429_9FIRM|nr:hypothetical protein [Ligaoa zhengdingensis]MBC8545975.1 hypothetical protein [Ligaoa zhengdingensis]
MGKQREDYYWHRLDNAAKVFPAVRSSSNSSVFRLSAKLKESVDPELLAFAVESALKELPTFRVKLRRGLFWYYWETNDQRPIILEDCFYPLRGIDKRQNNGYMFRVTYYGQKINLEMFHALTDGAGAMVLLKSIVYFYLKQRHREEVAVNELLADTGFSQHALDEDSFQRLRNRMEKKPPRPKVTTAYQLKGARYLGDRVDVTQGILPTGEVLKLAKQAGVTVTAYLVSLLLYAIDRTNFQYYAENKPVVCSVPVNLRGFFQSSTIRNFFSFITVSVNFHQKKYTFEQVLEEVSGQMKEALQLESLSQRLAYNLNAERNLAIRFIPLFAKNFFLRAIYRRGEKGYTTTLSNLGQVRLPTEQLPYVERFEALNNLTRSQCFKVCLCSLGERMTVSFVSGMEDKDVERFFFRSLANQGVEVQIVSNEVDEDEIL